MIKNIFRNSVIAQIFSTVARPGRRIYLASMTCAIIFALVSASVAISKDKSSKRDRSENSSDSGKVEIDVNNFGKVTDFFYRGAQPKEDEYSQLAELGIKTVIDLRDDPKDFAREVSEKNGLQYINMPMSDKDYPESDAAARFLQIVNNQDNWPVFVHCAGGRHRTGAMTAVYRMTIEGWDVERAYEEMKDYDFYTRWGHKAMKTYVFDYYKQLSRKRPDPSIARK